MTHKTLTAVILRFVGLLLFLKIFDYFGSYFISVYITTVGDPKVDSHSGLKLFFSQGAFLAVMNLVVSLTLIFKAEIISHRLVKSDNEINIQLNKKELIKAVLSIIALLWLAQSIYNLPLAIQSSIQWIKRLSADEYVELIDFSLATYMVKTIIALLFVLGINKISNYLDRK